MDFKISDIGELVLNSKNNDISTVIEDEERYQQAFCRVHSVLHDWRNEIGANLEEVISMPANDVTDKILKDKIVQSITKDGIYKDSDIYIEILHIENYFNVQVYLRNSDTLTSRKMELRLDLVEGISIKIGDDY